MANTAQSQATQCQASRRTTQSDNIPFESGSMLTRYENRSEQMMSDAWLETDGSADLRPVRFRHFYLRCPLQPWFRGELIVWAAPGSPPPRPIQDRIREAPNSI